MTDHYGDAIRAGAAALAKPYREPETIRAFTDEYPTLAAARVLEAALPHMRAAIIAEGITPGPCPAVTEFGHEGPYFDGVTPEFRTLRALCDLRAGHDGQHEAEDEQWGNFRWTEPVPASPYTDQYPALATKCAITHPELRGVVCWKEPGHADAHDNGAYMWTDEPPKAERCTSHLRPSSEEIAVSAVVRCERTYQHVGYHIASTYVWNNGGTVVAR